SCAPTLLFYVKSDGYVEDSLWFLKMCIFAQNIEKNGVVCYDDFMLGEIENPTVFDCNGCVSLTIIHPFCCQRKDESQCFL
ncbi:MAG: hypothetical protein IIX28_01000, partial [Clostridia bacterium]|nr:hypothetical protein [Clostridia bacterium]